LSAACPASWPYHESPWGSCLSGFPFPSRLSSAPLRARWCKIDSLDALAYIHHIIPRAHAYTPRDGLLDPLLHQKLDTNRRGWCQVDGRGGRDVHRLGQARVPLCGRHARPVLLRLLLHSSGPRGLFLQVLHALGSAAAEWCPGRGLQEGPGPQRSTCSGMHRRRYGHLFYCVLNSIIRTFFGSWSLMEPVGTGSGTALRRLVVRRGRCRAPRCCLPRDTPPGSPGSPQEPFSHALLGQRARRRLHSGALAQAAGAEVSLRTPGLSHVVASPPALVCGHPSP
jgi:hypothetical protein